MSFEDTGRRKRKGYQYVPDIPVEEPPLPAKRERKKVQYNDYVNPVKAIRKSPTRKRSPVRKYTKKTQRPGKKQKVSDSEEQEFLQSLNDKKRELEEKLLQINADLADVTEKLSVGKDSESEPEAEKDVDDNNDDNNDDNEEDNDGIINNKDKNDDNEEDSKNSNDADEEEMKDSKDEEEVDNGETESKKPAKKPVKKTKRRRSAAIKKKTKARSPDAKRTPRVTKIPEVLSPSELQAANQISFTKILNLLMKHRYASPFLEPVDPLALNIPDYPLIIKTPMDFGTIKTKLENKEYSTPKDFAEDVTLVFNNACTYNQPGSDVFIMATAIEEVFIKKINPLLTKQGFTAIAANHPNLPPMLQSRSVLFQPIAPPAGYSELKKSVDSLRKELQNLRSLENKVVTPKVPVKPEAPVPMTRDEKRRLSNDINKLPSEHLGVIVKIIKQKMPIGDVEEIVIDIDSLDTVTLRELEQYVLKVKRKGSRRGRPNSSKNNNNNNNNNNLTSESKLEIAKKSEELTAQRLEDVQKRLDELKKSAHARNSILTNSTTISFANPLDDLPFDEATANLSPRVNEKKEDSESESESGSDTDSEASSSDSGSDNESASESDSENPPNQ